MVSSLWLKALWEWKEKGKKHGDGGYSGAALGIATKIVLQGNASKGVQRPMTRVVRSHFRRIGGDFGVKFIEKEVTYSGY